VLIAQLNFNVFAFRLAKTLGCQEENPQEEGASKDFGRQMASPVSEEFVNI